MAESDLRPSIGPVPSVLLGLPGHCLKRVTLTRPTFCHSCSDFIWGLLGFQCEVCNFMCHEKCLKTLQWPCSSMAPSVVRVPVAHCFSPAGHKRRFCSVCRKPTTEGNTAALRCEVCELHVHADCAPFSCADCRRTHLDVFLEQDTVLQHHWREGNLPSAARCQVCRRTCSSSDVLAGVRCEWCGVTCHSACYLTLPTGCALARLRRLLLQPSCVRLQSRNFSKKHCYRITEGPTPPLLADDSDNVDMPPSVIMKDGQQGATESGKHFVKVFDGDDALKRGFFRLVLRASKHEDLVAAALRAFHLPGQPEDFLLHEVAECGTEAWLLRARRRDTEVVRVYLDWASGSSASFVSVGISNSSTAASVLEEVVLQLQQDKEASTISLVEVNLSSKQVQRVTLSPQEKILDKLQEIRKVSLRQMNQTCLYVQQQEVQQQEVQVGLLVLGLPPLLATEQYVQLLQQHLDMKSHLVTVSHTYSSQGAVALQVSCFSEAERLFMLARETVVDERSLTSLIIPHIQVQRLDPDVCPLLVFVNPRSGGLKGRDLLHSFRKLLNPHQVFDISNEGPLAGLHTFQQVVQFRVLVCGGDGTVGWVLAILEAIRHKMACREPPIAILPLGTGNDLARVLRWGAGYSSEEPLQLLHNVEEAEEVLMDRWTILLDHQDLSVENQGGGGGGDQFLEPPKIVQMNNYFGLGIDAELSLDFHQAREDQPDKFSSRFHNKSVYVKVGLQKLSSGRSLDHLLELQVDNQDVPLPHLQGLIFLNIPSWGSGADLWGSEVDGRFGKPRMDDGLLEVVGVTGVVHMGQIQSGMRSGIRIAQGNYIRLTLRSPVPVQVDGEPWVQLPGHIIISAAGPKVRMLRKSKQKQKKSSPRDVSRSESPAPADGCH